MLKFLLFGLRKISGPTKIYFFCFVLFVSGCCTAKHHAEGCLTVVLDDLEILCPAGTECVLSSWIVLEWRLVVVEARDPFQIRSHAHKEITHLLRAHSSPASLDVSGLVNLETVSPATPEILYPCFSRKIVFPSWRCAGDSRPVSIPGDLSCA